MQTERAVNIPAKLAGQGHRVQITAQIPRTFIPSISTPAAQISSTFGIPSGKTSSSSIQLIPQFVQCRNMVLKMNSLDSLCLFQNPTDLVTLTIHSKFDGNCLVRTLMNRCRSSVVDLYIIVFGN